MVLVAVEEEEEVEEVMVRVRERTRRWCVATMFVAWPTVYATCQLCPDDPRRTNKPFPPFVGRPNGKGVRKKKPSNHLFQHRHTATRHGKGDRAKRRKKRRENAGITCRQRPIAAPRRG